MKMDLKELHTVIKLIAQDETDKAIDALRHLVEGNNHIIDYQEIHAILIKKSAAYSGLKNEISAGTGSKDDLERKIAEIIKGTAQLTHEIKRKIEAGSSIESGHEKGQDTAEIEKQKFTKPVPPIIHIVTIGQVDHDKTPLTAAIIHVLSNNGFVDEIDDDYTTVDPKEVWCATPPINLNPALVEYQTANRRYAHLDYPDDTDYLKREMVTGATQMDGAILVVAATDGLTPQTREHILLAHKVGVPSIVVFLNNVDLVDDEKTLEGVEMEVRQLLNQYEFNGDDVSIIRGSVLKALEGDADAQQAIEDLMEACDTDIAEPQMLIQPFQMPVEDVFSINGYGTIATGRIERGVIETGDQVEFIGMRKDGDKPPRSTVLGIEMFRTIRTLGKAGDNGGIILRGIDKSDIKGGMVMCAPGSVKPHKHFKCEVYVLREEEGGRLTPFINGFRPQFYFRPSKLTLTGEVSLPDGVEMVMPGDYVSLEVKLIYSVAIHKRLKFDIREQGRSIGYGLITEIIE